MAPLRRKRGERMNVFALVAKLALDATEYVKGLGDAEKSAEGFGGKLKSGLGAAAKVGAAAVTAVSTAAVAAGRTLVNEAGQLAAYGDNIDKASQKLGISAEAYQEWDAVLQHSGTSIDAMGIGMKTLASAAADGSDAFARLGISQERAAKLSREDLFAETITALQNVADENERAQIAQDLFGRSAMELGPLLNTSAEDTQKMRDEVHKLGGVMSDEAVKAAAGYQDALQDMTTSIDGVKRGIVADFLPSITQMMQGITGIISGGDGADWFTMGVEKFVQALSDAIPRVVEIGGELFRQFGIAMRDSAPLLVAAADAVLTLGQGMIESAPMLMETGLQVVAALAGSISGALPELIPAAVAAIAQIVETMTEPDSLSQLIDGAIAILLALADGLIGALPRLIEAAPTIVLNLVEALVRNAPKLAVAGLQLMLALGKGIISSAGEVLSAVMQIGQGIADAIGNLVSAAWNWGKDLIMSFFEGIKAFISYPVRAVQDLAGRIRSFLGFSEPEEGPLSNFHTYAPDMMKLFAEGIEDNRGLITDAIGGAFDLEPMLGGGAAGREVVVPRSESRGGSEAVMEIDRMVFARLIFKLYNEEASRVGVNIAGVTA